jgi:nucleoside-diphosphate-sugar epimerase
MRRRKILITGASGRLGAILVQELAPHHDIVQLDIVDPQVPGQAGLGPVHVGSFTDPDIVARALDGVDTVVHSGAIPAAVPPIHKMVETNVLGTYMLLEAAGEASSVEQFVYISSIRAQGFHNPPEWSHAPSRLPIDETTRAPVSCLYGISKVQAEQWCRTYPERFGKPVVILRPSWIVPPAEYDRLLGRELDTTTPHLHDYVTAHDLADGVTRALDYHPPEGFDVFLMNADDQLTTTPSAKLVNLLFPGVPEVNHDKLASCDGFGALVDCSRARERLGWHPNFRCKR